MDLILANWSWFKLSLRNISKSRVLTWDHFWWLLRTHYIEHLADLLKANKIDPVGVMDATDAVQELRRHGKELPTRADYATDKEFLKVCVKVSGYLILYIPIFNKN